jgi:hypothetical protein
MVVFGPGRCVGSGHMALGARRDWQEHLKLARDELGFVGVRGHGLLDDDMSVMPNQWGSQVGQYSVVAPVRVLQKNQNDPADHESFF